MQLRHIHPVFLRAFQIAIVIAAAATFIFAQDTTDTDHVPAKLLNVPGITVPAEAKDAGVGGVVNVRVAIDEDGNVTEAEEAFGPDGVCPAVKTPPVVALRNAAKAAALLAKFTPATNKGKATDSKMFLSFKFPRPEKTNSSGGVSRTGVSSNKISEPNSTERAALDRDLPKIISGGVLNGTAMSLAKPGYPPAAKAVRAAGSVAIQVLIYEDGSVYSAEAVSGHPLLRAASRIAACDSKFTPTLLAGMPVKVSGVITYNFVP